MFENRNKHSVFCLPNTLTHTHTKWVRVSFKSKCRIISGRKPLNSAEFVFATTGGAGLGLDAVKSPHE